MGDDPHEICAANPGSDAGVPHVLASVFHDEEPGGMIGLSEANANARLMAASPELLEACREAKDFLIGDLVEPGRTVFWKLINAIRKAEGRS